MAVLLLLASIGADAQRDAPLVRQADQAWIEGNHARAVQLYEQAARDGNAAAMLLLGSIYKKGQYGPADVARSLHWYQQAADAGDAEGIHNVAELHFRGPDVPGSPLPRDRAKALEMFEVAFAKGWHVAGSYAGWMFDQGDGTAVDKAKAAHYYRGAARLGNGPAMANLAILLENGTGVAKDLRAARLWYLLAAQEGVQAAADALARLGPVTNTPTSAEAERLYAESNRVLAEDDYEAAKRKSFDFVRQAAELGHLTAIDAMADAFLRGNGVEENKVLARMWTLAGAELGGRSAQKRMGQFLVEGIGGPKDVLGARFWYEKAALAGDKQAMSLLAELYDGKFGFPGNPALSTHWYLQAYRAGDVRVQGILEDRGVLKPSPEAAAFITRIESAGPDASSPGAFMTDVAIYCKYGGSRCDQLSREALAMQRSHNASVRTADLQRIWNAGPSANRPASQGHDRAACLRKQTEALQRYTYGEQDWYFVGQC